MALDPGSRLGPYEILTPIGAGGMGEVFRARDPRLGRDVAIKVLPGSFSSDPERLKRFEQEARAAGVLNHPNVTAVYDIGTHEGAPYVVQELLEGETLRARLSGGALPVRKAIEQAIQIARGLAAAHEKGIVHRDLKPENLFVTRDGRVKILDFGLAKLTQTESATGQQTNLPTATATAGTEPGVVLGTLGYMSPEQVKGKPADQRSDIFSFGAILHEMLSGSRAFHRDSAAETMSAILREEPPDLSATNKSIQPGLERIVRHCLEKNPEERFQSARDMAFDLEALSGSGVSETNASPPMDRPRRKTFWKPLAIAAVLAAALATHFIDRKLMPRSLPEFHQLTFRRGQILSARFDPEGKSVLYSALWDGRPAEVFAVRPGVPESKSFGIPSADLLSVSRSGEMAVSFQRHYSEPFRRAGTLAQLSISGAGAPRDILDDVEWADWSPDGKSLAVVRAAGGKVRLEYPIGKVLFETSGWASHPRVSPDGDLVAFIDHPAWGDTGGSISTVDRSGHVRPLASGFESADGLAWSPGGEIWFTAAKSGTNQTLYSVVPGRAARARAQIPGNLIVHDVSRDGRLLASRGSPRSEIVGFAPGEPAERELTWLDWSVPYGLSPDGKTLLFSETGQGGGPGYSVYIRKTDGSPAVRLGDGEGTDLSPDGKWALGILHPTTDPQLVAYPTGAGEPKVFPREGLSILNALWLPDGKGILLTASEARRGLRLYRMEFSGGKARPLSPEGYTGFFVSPDGKWVAATGPDRKFCLYPISGGGPVAVPGVSQRDMVAGFCEDVRCVYVYQPGGVPLNVYKVDLATGRRDLWRTLKPADSSGVSNLTVYFTPDGKAYVYRFFRMAEDLYLVDGLR
jgi:eukaryotic-like serine/threonine-protein kinase